MPKSSVSEIFQEKDQQGDKRVTKIGTFNHDNSLTTIARLDDDISALPPSETVAYGRAH